jgi:hypothetical protein
VSADKKQSPATSANGAKFWENACMTPRSPKWSGLPLNRGGVSTVGTVMAIGMLYIRRLRDAAMTLSTARPGS